MYTLSGQDEVVERLRERRDADSVLTQPYHMISTTTPEKPLDAASAISFWSGGKLINGELLLLLLLHPVPDTFSPSTAPATLLHQPPRLW